MSMQEVEYPASCEQAGISPPKDALRLLLGSLPRCTREHRPAPPAADRRPSNDRVVWAPGRARANPFSPPRASSGRRTRRTRLPIVQRTVRLRLELPHRPNQARRMLHGHRPPPAQFDLRHREALGTLTPGLCRRATGGAMTSPRQLLLRPVSAELLVAPVAVGPTGRPWPGNALLPLLAGDPLA
jgi:hypothetical protein